MICPNTDKGVHCERRERNHPRCTGYDPEIEDFRNWDNPTHEPPKNLDRATAKATIREAAAATPADVRVDGTQPVLTPPEGRWNDRERALVVKAVRAVCERHRGGGEFTSDEVWTELGATVRKTPGLTSVLKEARHNGWLDSTGKKSRSQRARTDHDDGRELTLWYSLIPGA